MVWGNVLNDSVPLLFDEKLSSKHLLKRDFKACAPFYEWVENELAERIGYIKFPFKTIAQLGSLGLEQDMSLVKKIQGDTYLVLDFFGDKDHGSQNLPFHRVQTSSELLPLFSNAFDLVITALNFQFTNDLVGALKQINWSLKSDGFFQGVLLGGQTLKELHECLFDVYEACYGGMAPVTPPSLSPQECGYLLQRAGFTMPVVDRVQLTIFYDNPWQILKDIQRVGLVSPLFSKPFMGKDFLKMVMAFYEDRFKQSAGIPVTLDFIFFSGFKYAPQQPKPLKPGSGKISLIGALK